MASWGFQIFDAAGNLRLTSDDLMIRFWYSFTASSPGMYNYPQPLDYEPVVVNFINSELPTVDPPSDLSAYAWRHSISGGKYVGLEVYEPITPDASGPTYPPTHFLILARG